MSAWCYRKTEELGEDLLLAEQGIINLATQAFGIPVDGLDERFNCHPRHPGAKPADFVQPFIDLMSLMVGHLVGAK